MLVIDISHLCKLHANQFCDACIFRASHCFTFNFTLDLKITSVDFQWKNVQLFILILEIEERDVTFCVVCL